MQSGGTGRARCGSGCTRPPASSGRTTGMQGHHGQIPLGTTTLNTTAYAVLALQQAVRRFQGHPKLADLERRDNRRDGHIFCPTGFVPRIIFPILVVKARTKPRGPGLMGAEAGGPLLLPPPLFPSVLQSRPMRVGVGLRSHRATGCAKGRATDAAGEIGNGWQDHVCGAVPIPTTESDSGDECPCMAGLHYVQHG